MPVRAASFERFDVASPLVIRAPLAKPPGTTAQHYQIADDFAASGALRVTIDPGDPKRLKVQPAFPGTLTFKPAANQSIPLDPSDANAPPVAGTLFLELTQQKALRRLQRIPYFGYPVLLVYEGVTLPAAFFATVVAAAPILDATATARSLGRVQKLNAFARGSIGIDIKPTPDEAPDVWPSIGAGGSSTFSLTLGVRTHMNPLTPSLSVAQLSAFSAQSGPDFVRMPLAFFYGLLRRRGAEWSDLAAVDHVDHPFFDALDALEGAAGRWRRLRLFLMGPASDTSLPAAHLETLDAVATDANGNEIWRGPSNRLGEIFVKRPDHETFELTVVDGTSSNPLAPLPVSTGDPPVAQDSLALTWTAPPAAADAGINVFVTVAVDGDPADGPAFDSQPLMEGMKDLAGVTVDPIAKAVVSGKQMVGALQRLLASLGFSLAGTPRAEFDRETAWALKEFQCYAGLDTVATIDPQSSALSYADSLRPESNSRIYTGAIHGMLDTETALTLRAWRDNGYVCPVVIQSWKMRGLAQDELLHQNIWLPTDDKNVDHRMFAHDVSGAYRPPSSRAGSPIILGRYKRFEGHDGVLCSKEADSVWSPECDVTFGSLALAESTSPSTPPSNESISTYKVVAAVAQAENQGVFDVLNGYDRAVMSLGLCHWTVFLGADAAELPAALAYLQFLDSGEFDRLFGRFGISVESAWPDAEVDPNPLYIAGQAKWASRVRLSGLGASAKDSRYPSAIPAPLTQQSDANYLRNWHWFYRWVMAARTSEVLQRLQWALSRIRLRALLETPWPNSADTRHFGTVRNVFSSERAVAALLRAHVNKPAKIVSGKKAGDLLLTSVRRAGLAGTNPATWTPAKVHTLNQSLETELMKIDSIASTLGLATGYRDRDFGPLSQDAGSMKLDESGIELLR